MHGLLRQWLHTLSAKRQKRCLRKRALQKSEFEPDRGWSRDQFDTPTDHFERVPSDYVPKEGEEVYEFFVRQHSTGVWRVTRRAGGKSETASENGRCATRS